MDRHDRGHAGALLLFPTVSASFRETSMSPAGAARRRSVTTVSYLGFIVGPVYVGPRAAMVAVAALAEGRGGTPVRDLGLRYTP